MACGGFWRLVEWESFICLQIQLITFLSSRKNAKTKLKLWILPSPSTTLSRALMTRTSRLCGVWISSFARHHVIRWYADVPLCVRNVSAHFAHTNTRKAADYALERRRRWPKACREMGLNDGRSATRAMFYARFRVHKRCADVPLCVRNVSTHFAHTNTRKAADDAVERPRRWLKR